MKTKSKKSKTKAIIVIRDKDGNIKLDDYHNVPEELLKVCSFQDLQYIKQKRGNRQWQ